MPSNVVRCSLVSLSLLLTIDAAAGEATAEVAVPSVVRQTAVGLDLGVASALGFAGVTLTRQLASHWRIEAGAGLGMSGLQLSLMPKLVLGQGRDHFVGGAGVSVALPGDSQYVSGHPIWLNVDAIGYEHQFESGFALSSTLGLTGGLGGGRICLPPDGCSPPVLRGRHPLLGAPGARPVGVLVLTLAPFSRSLRAANCVQPDRAHHLGTFGGATMKCCDIMNKNVEWLTEKDSVRKAATVMAETGVGFLPICDAARRVIGVITDRDLTTRVLAKKIDPDATSAALVMSSPALTFLESAEVSEAESLMATERKARLVIIDADEKLTGVLDLADVVESAPGRQSLQTVRAIMWREALGPRGGAARGEPLLKDDPAAQNLPTPSDDTEVLPSVFVGAHRGTDTKEFPG